MLNRQDIWLAKLRANLDKAGYQKKDHFNGWPGIFAKSSAEGIPSRTGEKAGKAEDVVFCTIGNDGTIVETSTKLTVFNPFKTAVGPNTYITIKTINGTRLVVDAEDCE